MIRHAALLALALAAALPAGAAPVAYRLDRDASAVGYEVAFGPDIIAGRIPVAEAELLLDLADPARSRIRVALDAAAATASFPFAAQALTGPRVLDARRHPRIRFESTAVRGSLARGGTVEGLLTIRGVTRPVTLAATLYRRADAAADDLSRLSVLLEGRVSRAAFGADGWADLVADEVRIVILARIERGG